MPIGAADITLGAATLAATAAVTVTGAAAITLGAATPAATAAVTVTGAAAITLGALPSVVRVAFSPNFSVASELPFSPAYTWPLVSTVANGDRITSAQQNLLAKAFNARMLSGLGDATWRMWWKAYSLTRDFRQPQGGQFPAKDEWLEFYMHAAPEDGSTLGVLNFNANLPSFVHGNDSISLDAEDVLLNAIPTSGSTDPLVQWEHGKLQRGAYDPTTGNSGAPAFDAAEYAGRNQWVGTDRTVPSTSPILSVWGGYLPGPKLVDCGGVFQVSGDEFTFFSRALNAVSHVFSDCVHPNLFIRFHSDHYEIWVDGAVTHRLFYSQYYLIPRDPQAGPGHAPGWQMHEAFNAFAASFRGSDAQRASANFGIKDIGFDFERFLARQYLLSPARGNMVETFFGSGILELVADYHLFAFDATGVAIPPFTKAEDADLADNYDFGANFCFAGYKVTSSGLTGPVSIRLQHVGDTQLLENPTITVQNGSRVYWFELPETGTLEIVSQTVIPIGATIVFELAPLWVRKPKMLDAYIVTRRGSCRAEAPDVGGWDYPSAKEIGDNYFATGCIVNGQECAVNNEPNIQDNPVYEANRRMLRENFRLLKRESFQGYEVVGGKAVLLFGRTTAGSPGLDIFSGFAPPLTAIPSGALLSGVEYRVKGVSGAVNYGGSIYPIGATFTALPGIRDYTMTGEASPHQINGIITVAPQSGQTNEWSLFLGFTTYDGGALSLEDYSDPAGMMISRCSLLGFGLSSSGGGLSETMAAMADTHPQLPIDPKTPAGWIYAERANQYASNTFFNSCKIYQPDYVVERIEYDEAGRVKVTLSGPLRTATATERQDDNGLTDYRTFITGGVGCPKRIGDNASDPVSDITNGSCVPRFHFTRQMPRVHEDGNDTQEDTDTRCLASRMQWMDWALDAMAPGYLDKNLLNVAGQSCAPRFVNYTKDSLFFQAAGWRWQPLPAEPTKFDLRQGFGDMPNTVMRASKFNGLAAAINLLNVLPVNVPIPLEYEATTTVELQPAGLSDMSGVWWRTLAPNETPSGVLLSTEIRPWLPNPVASGVFFSIQTHVNDLGALKYLQIVTVRARFRISRLVDLSNAFPPGLNQLMREAGTTFLAYNTWLEFRHHNNDPGGVIPAPCGPGGVFTWDPAIPIRPIADLRDEFPCDLVELSPDFFSSAASVDIPIPPHGGGVVAKQYVNAFDGCGFGTFASRLVAITGVSRVTVPLT